jgi:thiamine phosphate synthase YjbQ (UPF0047 family)
MRQATHIIRTRTPGRGLIDVTAEIRAWVREQGMRAGLLTVFCRHTLPRF